MKGIAELKKHLAETNQIVCTHFHDDCIIEGKGYYYLSPADFYENGTICQSWQVEPEDIKGLKVEDDYIVFPGERIKLRG